MTMLLVNACVFADIREVPAMYNCAINMIIKTLISPEERYILKRCIRRIWENTAENSTLWLFYIQFLIDVGDIRELLTNEDVRPYFNEQTIRDLAIGFYDRDMEEGRVQLKDFWNIRGNYHMHGSNQTSCSDDFCPSDDWF